MWRARKIHTEGEQVSTTAAGVSDIRSEAAKAIPGHLRSDCVVDLAAMFDPEVELVTVLRLLSPGLAGLAEHLFARRVEIRTQWIQCVDGAGARRHLDTLGEVADVEGFDDLGEEVDASVAALACLLDCPEVGVRLATLRRPMCPKFHVDRIPCRMLVTLAGPATEWIPRDRVDWALFADREETRLPLKPGCGYEALEPEAWTLMKGGEWQEGFPGVVHRSPLLPGNRLMITLDPVFR